MTLSLKWVPLANNDLPEVNRIADIIHPGLPERPEIFSEKFELFPGGCFKFVADGRIYGYGISHPWKVSSIPELDSFLVALPQHADCIYIHDVAVLEDARGHRAAETYVAIMRGIATSLSIPKLTCVSVYGTNVLWRRFGFEVVEYNELSKKLKSYGPTAKYMVSNVKTEH